YLVRRLLENGANSSFVNQIVNEDVAPETVAACPLTAVEAMLPGLANARVVRGPDLFAPERANSQGFDLTDAPTLARIDAARGPFASRSFAAAPILAAPATKGTAKPVLNPATGAAVDEVTDATAADVDAALAAARPWAASQPERAAILNRAADLYEADFGPIFALLAREAGKTLPDAVAELR